MLIGDPTDFAIEAMVEPDLKAPSAVWRRMRIHLGNVTLGDFDDPYCALYPAYGHFKWHAKLNDQLWNDSFNGMIPEEIHDTVREAIYGDDERTTDQIQRDSLEYGRFDFLTNWGEQFDGYSSVILSPKPTDMMVLHRPFVAVDSPRRLPDAFVVAHCSRAAFVTASLGFVKWFDEVAERLLPRNA
ncbi:hypothetical protein Poly21_15300 [Allorhodopirellula heiligendammensis]|uniref:Uncharacterized protein n=2 Tax=Allorhodopirellula heiligendammensis TaxID=2714739 RepID=A0A5C6C5A3_9BACT|nr:hypothetical protein Poly21_15300 [Allorhodopirellula heiligendammensis]